MISTTDAKGLELFAPVLTSSEAYSVTDKACSSNGRAQPTAAPENAAATGSWAEELRILQAAAQKVEGAASTTKLGDAGSERVNCNGMHLCVKNVSQH